MRSLILTAITFVGAASVSAQPVLNPEKFSTGDKADYHNALNPETVQKGNPGANITWDFSNLVKESALSQQILAPSATSYASTFPAANAVRKTSDGSQVFLNVQSDKNEMVGFVRQAQNLVISYANPLLLIKRPASYNEPYSDNFAYSYKYMGENYTGGGSRTVLADGYGTLILPGKTYPNVLRVRSEHISNDTGESSGIITVTQVVTYAWYDADHSSPLFEIESTRIDNPFYKDSFQSARYLVNETLVSINESSQGKLHKVFRLGNKLVLEGEFKANAAYDIVVTNSLGQFIAKSNRNYSGKEYLAIDIKSLSGKGIYFISVSGSDSTCFTGSYLQF